MKRHAFVYKKEIITTGGKLKIDAFMENPGDEVQATMTDETGEWKKSFLHPEDLKEWVSRLHTKQFISSHEERNAAY